MLSIHKTVPCTLQNGACQEGSRARGVCSLWARSSQLSRQFRKGSDVCPASPLGVQSDGWKCSSKIRGRNTMQGKGKRCHSLGLCVHRCGGVWGYVCVCLPTPAPPLPSHFLKNRQELERHKKMWPVFLLLPFLHYKFLNRPKRVNCFFKFYQQESSPEELQFSAQRLCSCLAWSFQTRK